MTGDFERTCDLSEYSDCENNSFLVDRREYGCVVRAIESFFGKKATDDEWTLRIDVIKPKMVQIALLDTQEPNDAIRDDIRRRIVEEDVSDVRRYINELSRHNTPLGLAISSTALCYTIQNWEETEKIILSGTDLLVACGMIIDKYEGFIGHMAHLRRSRARKNEIFSRSDRCYWEFNFSDKYYTIRKY